MPRLLALLILLAACTDPAAPAEVADDDDGDVMTEPPPGPPPTGCEASQHLCGDVCVPNRANTPSAGCEQDCNGACEAPANGYSVCTESGLCDFACDQYFTRVGSECVADVCTAVNYSCGSYTSGGQTVDCGTCVEGATCGGNHVCQIARDVRESNDTLQTATNLGTFNDRDDRHDGFKGLTIDSKSDVDWFTFKIVDGFDAGNPDGYITLTHSNVISGVNTGWLESRHKLTAWFKCDGADNGSSVSCGEWFTTYDTDSLHDPVLGVGCTIERRYVVWADISPSCATIDDNGTVTVKVEQVDVPMGDTYDLGVSVE